MVRGCTPVPPFIMARLDRAILFGDRKEKDPRIKSVGDEKWGTVCTGDERVAGVCGVMKGGAGVAPWQ